MTEDERKNMEQSGYYTGEKPLPLRPGAMDAYECPSLWQGERIERRRPMLIGAQPEQARPGRG